MQGLVSGLTMTNTELVGNAADSGCGGGLGVSLLSTLQPQLVEDSFVQDNTAGVGGGFCVAATEMVISSTLVENNRAGDQAGGIYIALGELEIDDVSLVRNAASRGGALFCDSSFVAVSGEVKNNQVKCLLCHRARLNAPRGVVGRCYWRWLPC